LMTVAWSRRLAGSASSALSTSACDAPGLSGGGGGGAPRPSCAPATPAEMMMTAKASNAMRFMVILQILPRSVRIACLLPLRNLSGLGTRT
jgi:hypothetical protein